MKTFLGNCWFWSSVFSVDFPMVVFTVLHLTLGLPITAFQISAESLAARIFLIWLQMETFAQVLFKTEFKLKNFNLNFWCISTIFICSSPVLSVYNGYSFVIKSFIITLLPIAIFLLYFENKLKQDLVKAELRF